VIDVSMFTVGMVQENCFLVRAEGSDRAVIVDPGEEAPRLLQAIEDAGVTLDAILLTHTHFDHVGAVAPLARATGAPVYCPVIEVPVLQDVMAYVPWPGFGPYESWDPEHTVAGGETLELAGLTLDVVFTPGHSPGHMSLHIRSDGEEGLLTGDVAHHPIQMAHLEWSSTADFDPVQSAVARRELFARFADTPTLVIGGHFGAGQLKRDGGAFRLVV